MWCKGDYDRSLEGPDLSQKLTRPSKRSLRNDGFCAIAGFFCDSRASIELTHQLKRILILKISGRREVRAVGTPRTYHSLRSSLPNLFRTHSSPQPKTTVIGCTSRFPTNVFTKNFSPPGSTSYVYCSDVAAVSFGFV